jgi:hypothetical protein
MTEARRVTCRSCRAWIEDRGRLRRCPRCGAELDTQPLPDLPGFAPSGNLDVPAFAPEERPISDTAPLSEFIAAGAVVVGLAMLVAGAVLSSGAVALSGVALAFLVLLVFSLFKGSLGRALLHYRETLWWGGRLPDAVRRDRERDKDDRY